LLIVEVRFLLVSSILSYCMFELAMRSVKLPLVYGFLNMFCIVFAFFSSFIFTCIVKLKARITHSF
jgi:hypothetical protein